MERINEPSEPHSELCRITSYLKNKRRTETSKILLLLYNTVNSTILCLELYCSSIAKKFAILLFTIPNAKVFEA